MQAKRKCGENHRKGATMYLRGLRRWQMKAMLYGVAIAVVPVRHDGTLHTFAQLMVGLLTGSLS
jgi:hypothetical protein